jgi:hypothetical protein
MPEPDYDGAERRAPGLSEHDRDAIAAAIWDAAKRDLYLNAGKGLVNIVWKMFIAGLVMLAVYGYAHGWFG